MLPISASCPQRHQPEQVPGCGKVFNPHGVDGYGPSTGRGRSCIGVPLSSAKALLMLA